MTIGCKDFPHTDKSIHRYDEKEKRGLLALILFWIGKILQKI